MPGAAARSGGVDLACEELDGGVEACEMEACEMEACEAALSIDLGDILA
eukprot:SAG25_NODE_4565_length_789_cov_1.034783_1_plen_49_part_00